MQDNIFGLYIPVNDPQWMNLVDRLTDLLDVSGDFLLGHGFAAFKLMVKLAACSNLQNNVNISLVIKVAVHFDDVWVVEEHLNLKFSDKLLHNLLIL